MISNFVGQPIGTEKVLFSVQKTEMRGVDLATYVGRNPDQTDAVSKAFRLLDIHWPNLPGAEQEVEEVGELFDKTRRSLFKGSAASEDTLQRLNRTGELTKYRYLLFSTHGYLSLFEPALSSIVLSQTRSTIEADGYVTASEWVGYSLNSELAVMSACDTAVGKVIQGEGVTGLPYALAVAGNRRTVMSLWPVADEGTKEFMVSFFRRLRDDGVLPRKALSETKREFLKNTKFDSPLFWAPFVLYGG